LRFTVLRCKYHFDGDPDPLPDRHLIVLGHREEKRSPIAICLKATSQVKSYLNNPAKMAGAVFYRAGTIQFFQRDTVIQPDNPLLIPHSNLLTQHATGDLAVLGIMPAGFADDLIRAIEASTTIAKARKRNLLDLAGLSGTV